MIRRFFLATASACGLMMFGTTGCGTSGSGPPLFPEVRFEVSPVQGAQPPFQFIAERFDIGGVEHTDLAGTTLTATGVFRFIFENAAPSYCGTFRQVGATAVTVHLIQEGGPEVSPSTSGDGTEVTACLLGSPTPMPTAANPEVRFDVCAQSIPGVLCAAAGGDPGKFDVQFSGVIGDPFVTYLVGTASATANVPVSTPVIYYFEGASQSVNAVFTGFNQATIQVQLLINGQLSQNVAGNGNLTLQQDL